MHAERPAYGSGSKWAPRIMLVAGHRSPRSGTMQLSPSSKFVSTWHVPQGQTDSGSNNFTNIPKHWRTKAVSPSVEPHHFATLGRPTHSRVISTLESARRKVVGLCDLSPDHRFCLGNFDTLKFIICPRLSMILLVTRFPISSHKHHPKARDSSGIDPKQEGSKK